MNDVQYVRLRRKPAARIVERPGGVSVYPEPHVAPVLPRGWPPLEVEDETCVLQACDAFTDACRLRLGSVWDAAIEYRVYCLEAEAWHGVCAATLFTTERSSIDGRDLGGRNTRLLAIGQSPEEAARIAVDFLNWDLQADGNAWRLALAPVP